ncbi:MAG: DegT/DnrJ/EryC1/StrS family aminotransferase [Bacteroidales bacterium]|nr:DegT/DnrJ/EryC1/StrS family aminotransferase [Bacteroidales bacterium]
MNKKNKHLAINGGNPVTKENIIIHKPYLLEDDFIAVDRSLRSTFVSGDGPDCRKFEANLKQYLGVKHVLFTNSCTGALDLAFMIKKFPAEGEVIVPNFTYTSTALAPLLNNLRIILVDVYKENGNVDISKIKQAITSNTVAIMPVDYAGNPAEMDAINEIARKHRLYVVHDTAQSIGSTLKGKLTGSMADVSCFSFHGTKNITTGEGGALVTDNDEIAELVKIARDKGTDKWAYISDPTRKGFYEYVSLGNSYVQSNILGALGVTQLNKIEIILQKRKEIANYYISELKGITEIELPTITNKSEINWHLFYILAPPEDKLWIMDALRAEGIGCNVHYNPLHMNLLFKNLAHPDLENSVKFYNRLLRLPIYPSLEEEEAKLVIKAVKKVFGY